MSEMVETVVYREPWDINRRILELGLTVEGLHRVSAEATSFHPANAAGTFAYQYGTWALRSEFVGKVKVWEKDTEYGVEAIRNNSAKVKVIYANVDIACNDEQPPKPRSRKGAGSERACQGNLSLFGSLPRYAPRQNEEGATYYFMVDEDGAAELTRPIIKGSTFSAYVERIYLPKVDDIDATRLHKDNDPVDIDPVVARK